MGRERRAHLSIQWNLSPVSNGQCMSRPSLYAVEPVSSGHCMSRSPLYAVEPVSSGHCILSIQWNLSLVVTV